MKTGMSKKKLLIAGAMIALSFSFIYNKNKTIKVELTKYFESKEGYGDHVVFIDQDKWISADNGVLYCWKKDKLTQTVEMTFYNGENLTYNSAGKKIFAGTYTFDLSSKKAKDLPSLQEVYTEEMESAPGPSAGYFALGDLAWDKDGKGIFLFTKFFPSKHLETTSYSGIKERLLLVDPLSGKLSKVIWEGKKILSHFKLGITDKYLIAAGAPLMIFDKISGKLIKEIDHGSYAVLSIAFNSSGSVMAIGKSDGILKLYKMNEGWASIECPAHTDRIRTIAFHPSLDLIATGGEDKKLKIWKMEDGKLVLLNEMTFDDDVAGIAFDKEGKRLSVSQKGADEKMQQFNLNISK
jgi:WD40 repeat protein